MDRAILSHAVLHLPVLQPSSTFMFYHLMSCCANSRGAKVAGQREWGWACQQLGIPRFPRDFPDCQAAVELTQLLSAEHVRSLHLLLLIPMGKLRHCATTTSQVNE